jgi:hypothetical protein
MYLIRPDKYVALAAEKQDPLLLSQYLADHALSLPF